MTRGQIVVAGLTKLYPKVRAVDDLSFTVQPGRVTGFLGPNGSGKTTTLRMILNLVTPTSGGATIGGQPYPKLAQPLREVGAVLEAASAHRGRSGRDHLRMICATAGYPDQRADEVLDLVGLTAAANRRFKGYSLGMRQRLGIAMALLGNPYALILDEPANGLDPIGIRWMRELLSTLARQGRTVFVSSHLLAEVEQLADDVIIIAAGRLVAQGSLADVVGRRGQTVRVRTPQAPALTEELVRRGAQVEPAGPDTLTVAGVPAAEVGRAALQVRAELHELVTEAAHLEQAFLALTEAESGLR